MRKVVRTFESACEVVKDVTGQHWRGFYSEERTCEKEMDPASPNTPRNTMLDKVKSSFKQKANILDSDPPDNKAKSIVAGIIPPFIDIFHVDVRGSILWIPYTNLILQVAYFGLSLFGVIIFISGLLKTGMDLSDKITKSELLPMSTDGVKFPMMIGCFSENIAQLTGFSVGSLLVLCPSSWLELFALSPIGTKPLLIRKASFGENLTVRTSV